MPQTGAPSPFPFDGLQIELNCQQCCSPGSLSVRMCFMHISEELICVGAAGECVGSCAVQSLSDNALIP